MREISRCESERLEMIEYYTDRMTPAQHEERARAWAEEVRGLGKWRRSRVMRQIAAREALPPLRVFGWVKWAEAERE